MVTYLGAGLGCTPLCFGLSCQIAKVTYFTKKAMQVLYNRKNFSEVIIIIITLVNNTCISAFSQLYNIRRIRKYLTMDTSKTLVHAMITSRIDYCNSLLCGLPDNSLNKLQRVQNAAARLITGTAKFSHITPVLRSLHWLPIKQRVQFKMLILIFKAINGLAPNYISNLVNILCPSKYLLRRNNEILLEPYNGKTKKTLGDRAFAVAAPRLFNSLPREIRHVLILLKLRLRLFCFAWLSVYCI